MAIFEQIQSQQLYEAIHLIAKILAEAYIEEKNKLNKHSSVVPDNDTVIYLQQNQKLTLTVDEATKLLGIGRSKAYEMINTGEIPSVKFGRKILIPRNRLIGMINKQ